MHMFNIIKYMYPRTGISNSFISIRYLFSKICNHDFLNNTILGKYFLIFAVSKTGARNQISNI